MPVAQPVTLTLPTPWAGQAFTIGLRGGLSFLVGPNGSGKSRFATALKSAIPKARLLGTDRLQQMSAPATGAFFGDNFASGYQKGHFGQIRQAGENGSGLDAFLTLEERPDIRVIVEATLSSLFKREIFLEWDSGILVPKVRLSRAGDTYRLDRDECHGIRELLVLLTHLHNDQYSCLIVDEPELNLHPQFQSFFLQEARKVAGQHAEGTSKKAIVLITHSPFILDLRNFEDLQSVFSFSAEHSVPKFIGQLQDAERDRLASLVPRLNVHHKQLFFADNPIFVEGISDAQLVEAIQERRSVSITAAGSCLIDVGGCEEVTKYLELCRHYSKKAYFLFDLDSLFTGSLRQCIRDDGKVSDFLASLGLGPNFAIYCGALDRVLTAAVRSIEGLENADGAALALQSYFKVLSENEKKLARQRVAVLIEIAANRGSLNPPLTEAIISDIDGRLRQIQKVLEARNIRLLSGGALEHYLPSYVGDRYNLSDGAKRSAVATEVAMLATGQHDSILATRYGELFEHIAALPGSPPVDVESVLRGYVSTYIHELQGLVLNKPDWSKEQMSEHFEKSQTRIGKLISLTAFERPRAGEFRAVLEITGPQKSRVEVSHETNAGMRRFTFQPMPAE